MKLFAGGKGTFYPEMIAVEDSMLLGIPYVAGGVADQPTWFMQVYRLRQKIESNKTWQKNENYKL